MQFVRSNEARDIRRIEHAAREYKVPKLTAQALLNRGIHTKEQAEAFLHPSLSQLHDPYLLPDMKEAVQRIQAAITRRERICIYGDYDADGVCASAILWTYFKLNGITADVYLPLRHEEGYGINQKAVEKLKNDGVCLVITVDTGITAAEEIALLQSYGVDVIVTDHHQCPERLPKCVAVIDPHRSDSVYPFADLCGAGVAFKLVQALGAALDAYLPYAALATVADIVPLLDENRAIVSCGMPKIASVCGLRELLKVSGVGAEDATSSILAFRLAPRINAAGRMGDAMRAFSLMIESDEEKAKELAHLLNEENIKRQTEERKMTEQAEELLRGRDTAAMRAILLYHKEWNQGVIGIVASKIVERYDRPVLLFTLKDGLLHGSARSIPGVHLFEVLSACAAHLIKYGGHAQAAGLTLRLSDFPAFESALDAYLKKTVAPEVYTKTVYYEMEAPLTALTYDNICHLHVLEPYGAGNPEPVFFMRDVRLKDKKAIGSDGAHMRANVQKDGKSIQAIGFHFGRYAAEPHERADIVYTAGTNDYMDMRRIQLQLKAFWSEPFFQEETLIERIRPQFYRAFFENVLHLRTFGCRAEGALNGAAAPYTAGEALDEAVRAAMKRDIHGTLFIANTPRCAQNMKRILCEAALEPLVRICYNTISDESSAHTLLLAPVYERLQIKNYRQIIIADAAALQEFIAFPKGGGGVRVEAHPGEIGDFFSPLKAERNTLLRYYAYFKNKLKDAPLKREQFLEDEGPDTMLALLVFLELGLIRFLPADGTLVLAAQQKRRELSDSALYRAVNAHRESRS